MKIVFTESRLVRRNDNFLWIWHFYQTLSFKLTVNNLEIFNEVIEYYKTAPFNFSQVYDSSSKNSEHSKLLNNDNVLSLGHVVQYGFILLLFHILCTPHPQFNTHKNIQNLVCNKIETRNHKRNSTNAYCRSFSQCIFGKLTRNITNLIFFCVNCIHPFLLFKRLHIIIPFYIVLYIYQCNEQARNNLFSTYVQVLAENNFCWT